MNFNNKINSKVSGNRGFTLIEMIVSLALFTVVAVVSIGALLKIMDANRKSITLKTVTNNINFALESMTREMRVGTQYYISQNINSSINKNYNPTEASTQDINVTSGPWVIAFNSSKPGISNGPCNLIYAYRYTGTKLQKAQQSGDCNTPIVSGDFKNIVSDDVIFTNVSARVDARAKPIIDLTFTGHAGIKDKEKIFFNIQTKINQRIQ